MTRPPTRELLTYLAPYDPHLSNLTLAVRNVVLEEAPRAIESISKGDAIAIGYAFTSRQLKDGFCLIVTYSVLLGRSDGTFAPAVNYGTGSNPWSVAVGDFNGDGKLDLAVVNQASSTLSVLLGRGDGTFRAAMNYALQALFHAL
jgi:hypothetical protein